MILHQIQTFKELKKNKKDKIYIAKVNIRSNLIIYTSIEKYTEHEFLRIVKSIFIYIVHELYL